MVFIGSIVLGILSKDMSWSAIPHPATTAACTTRTFAHLQFRVVAKCNVWTRVHVPQCSIQDTRQYRSIGPGLGDDLSPHIISSPDCHCNVQLHCVSLKYSHLNSAPTIKGLHVNTNGPRTKPRNSSVCCSFQVSRIQIEHMQSNACVLQELSTGLRKSSRCPEKASISRVTSDF